jgi:phosphatidylglycerophosphatase A
LIGSLGPCGHLPASGTCTVLLVGVPIVWLCGRWAIPVWAYMTGLFALTALAVWVHELGDRLLGTKDSRLLVLDELVGFFIAMIGVSISWRSLLVGFLLERTLDILKVWPANRVEQRWPGGWGVVGDDVVAGIYALAVMHVLTRTALI